MTNLISGPSLVAFLRRYGLALGVMLAMATVAVGSAYQSGKQIPIAYAAQADYFLKLEGVDGESQDSQHQGTIEINSWSWGASNAGITRGSTGGGGGSGKASFQDISFMAGASKASPKLMLAAASGKHFPKATLMVRKSGTDRGDYYTITLSDVVVTAYGNSGTGGAEPSDQFSLNYAKIEFEYKPMNSAGTTDAPIKAGWNVKANKGI